MKKQADFHKKYSGDKNAHKHSKHKGSKGVERMQYKIMHSLHPERWKNENIFQ